jgi:alpha-N-arabinofuranosidase
MINVLQSMILTDKEKMILTPTYYVYKMYVPFQGATFIPVNFDAGTYTQGAVTLPRLDAVAARDTSGRLILELTNLDPVKPLEIDADLNGFAAKSSIAQTLTAAAVDSINSFDTPENVVPRPVSPKIEQGRLKLSLDPKSVTVITLEQ